MPTTEPIAIVGMAGRFPGSDGIDEFWSNLVAGRDCVVDLTDEELLRHHEDPDRLAHPDYVRRRPVVADSDALDAELFSMTPREAEIRDPQYRILLETVHAALEHAGYDPAGYDGGIGLFAGTNVNRYRYDHVESNPDVVAGVGWGTIDIQNHPDYLTTYIAYKLGLRGPSATVLTACSSSLVAVHLACTALRNGDCEMALAGGVSIEFPFHRGYVPTPGWITAFDGVVRPFDADSTGTNFGDGVGVVLLKPLAAALADNDTVYATILGSAINNDGARKVGFSAPSSTGQGECIRRALLASGVDPADIRYVEAHGTATRIGDPIELAGLVDAYRSVSSTPLPAQYCGIGSVKSNIGHLGQAAGVAGLIKATLTLVHAQVPPSIGLSAPNPEVDWADSPFYVNTELRDWPAEPDRPRRAGVSSFGIGGTNSHVVLEEAPAVPHRADPRRPKEILLWSAMNATAEAALRERLAGHFAGLAEDRFADSAYTLRVGRTRRPVRAALAATGPADAAAGLRDARRVWTADGVDRETVFAFPGQGAQYPGMCRELYDAEPLFRQGCDAAFEVLAPLLGRDLGEVWRAGAGTAELAETELAQPLLYVLESTLAHCLVHWGVTPAALVGHSLGELVAGAVAGVFDFETGLRAVAARARHIQQMPRGRMLAVAADRDAVADLLTGEVVLAAVNGPGQVVLSGPADAIDAVAAELAGRGVTGRVLDTSHAFHSPAMAEAAARFEKDLGDLVLNPPAIPVLSAATGGPVSEDQATSPAFWARQLVEPVDFDAAAAVLYSGGAVNVVEVGPGTTLAALLRGRADARATGSRVLPAVGRRQTDGGREQAGVGQEQVGALGATLARLWVDGAPVSYWRQDQERGYRRIAVPGYPYQRRRYWLDLYPATGEAPEPARDAAAEPARDATAEPASPPEPADPDPSATEPSARWRLAELEWHRVPVRVGDLPAGTAGAAVLLLPADPGAARVAQAAVQRAGYRTSRAVDGRDGAVAGAGRTAIDPTDPDAWLALLDGASTRATGEVLLIHAALLSAPDQVDSRTLAGQLATGLGSLHAALKAAAAFQRRRRTTVRLLVLGRGLVDVTGAERVNPASAAVLGLLRTAVVELPGVRCGAVDVGGAVAETVLSDAIVRPAAPLLALRGVTTWLPRLRPLPEAPPETRLRHRGTYLITGGLGGLGLVVARALAETGRFPNLALLGRTPLDELADRAAVEAELAAIAEAGAEVDCFPGDVGDAASLGAAVDRVQERFGPISGVIHAAGVAGGGLLELRDPGDVWRVLHPKAAGVLAIEEVFAGRAPLDFLLLFSSAAALSGLYGSADYAAANAFLDAHSASRAAGERRTISVQWPGWAEVGMLARSAGARVAMARQTGEPPAPAAADSDGAALAVLRVPGTHWEFDEHVVEGLPVLPGTFLTELALLGVRRMGEDWPLEVQDMVFLAPVTGDRAREVRVLASPIGAEHQIIVQSRAAGTSDAWTDNATATIGPVEPGPEPGPAPELAEIRGRLSAPGMASLGDWIQFGPRWDCIADAWGDDSERLVRLVLPPVFHADLAEHPLHPAILDAATGVLLDLAPGARTVPLTYRRLLVLAPLTADVMVHSRFAIPAGGRGRRPVDMDIFDTATGRLLVRVESFTLRELASGQGFGVAAGSGAAAEPRVHRTGEPRADELLPEEGAAVLLDLLGRAYPPVVLIDMAGAALAPAGIPWSGEPPASADPGGDRAPAPPPRPAAPAPAALAAEPAGGPDGVAEALRRLWAGALGTEDIGLDDDYFELGGNSLGAVQLTARINAHFGTNLGAGTLFDASTVRLLADELKTLGAR